MFVFTTLEPSFEMTLRAADISEEVITDFRDHRIKNAATFAAMDTTPEELKDTVRESLWRRHGKARFTAQGGVGQYSQRLVGGESKSRGKDEVRRSRSSTWAIHPVSHERLGVRVVSVQNTIWAEHTRSEVAITKMLRVVRRATSTTGY